MTQQTSPPCRVPFFAVLVSLVNRTAVEASEAIVTEAGKRLTASLAHANQPDPGNAPSSNQVTKAILRFYCGLGTLGVISCSSVIARFQEFIDKAFELVSAESDGTSEAKQAYGDMLVEAVLLALPWGGKALFEQEREAMEALFKKLHEYMAARPKKVCVPTRAVSTCTHPHPRPPPPMTANDRKWRARITQRTRHSRAPLPMQHASRTRSAVPSTPRCGHPVMATWALRTIGPSAGQSLHAMISRGAAATVLRGTWCMPFTEWGHQPLSAQPTAADATCSLSTSGKASGLLFGITPFAFTSQQSRHSRRRPRVLITALNTCMGSRAGVGGARAMAPTRPRLPAEHICRLQRRVLPAPPACCHRSPPRERLAGHLRPTATPLH